MSRLSITHQPKRLVENRPNATENRPNATFLCHLRALLCHLATLLRHSVHVANSDLRRIACDFLTLGNRMGESNPKPTDDRGNFLPRTPKTATHRSFGKSTKIARKRSCIQFQLRLPSKCTGPQVHKRREVMALAIRLPGPRSLDRPAQRGDPPTSFERTGDSEGGEGRMREGQSHESRPPAQFPACLRHAPAGRRSRHPHRARTARPRQCGNHDDRLARSQQRGPRRHQPGGSAVKELGCGYPDRPTRIFLFDMARRTGSALA